MSSLESLASHRRSSSIILINTWSHPFPSLLCSYRNRHLNLFSHILSWVSRTQRCYVTPSSLLPLPCHAFSAPLCSSIFLPSGLIRGSRLCNRLYVYFSKTARKQLCDAAEGEANALCFECLTERERNTDGKVNNLTDAIILQDLKSHLSTDTTKIKVVKQHHMSLVYRSPYTVPVPVQP